MAFFFHAEDAIRVLVRSRGRGDGYKSQVDCPAHRFIDTISKAGKPIVAAVQGNAVGVGTTMLLHCDLVYLAETARLITPFVNLALVPEAASSWLLPLRIGHARAYAMFALGEPKDAQGAQASGLANAVVPPADLSKHRLLYTSDPADEQRGVNPRGPPPKTQQKKHSMAEDEAED